MDKLPKSSDNYTPIALDLPNIIVWAPTGHGLPASKLCLYPGLRDLALDLAKRKPNWQLCCLLSETTDEKNSDGSISYLVHRLSVFQSEEYLGYIRHGYDYSRSEYRYTLDTPRLRNSRQRGSYTSTGDAVKARKLVLKHFQPKSMEEVFLEAANGLDRVASSAKTIAGNQHTYAAHKVRNSAYTLVADNWDEFAGRLTNLPDDCKDYPTLHATALATEDLYAQYNEGKGTTVIIKGEQYYMQGIVNGIYAADTVPEHLKRGLGLLKLLDDNTAYPGIGIRLDATRFFVVDDPIKT